jgi:hypothetical protein
MRSSLPGEGVRTSIAGLATAVLVQIAKDNAAAVVQRGICLVNVRIVGPAP